MTDAEIKAARELCEAATEGPWEALNQQKHLGEENRHIAGWCIRHETGVVTYMHVHTLAKKVADAEFIAASRTRWPAALAEVERLRGVLRLVLAEAETNCSEMKSLITCVNLAEDALSQKATTGGNE